MNESRMPFSIPTASGREWMKYDARRQVWASCRAPGKSQPSGYVYSAFEGESFPLWVNSEDPQVVPQLVSFEIERLTGRTIPPGDPSLAIRKILRRDQHILVQTSVIGDQIDLEISRNWRRFLVSPFLRQNGRNDFQLWQENDRWVAAFFVQGFLAHWHAFGKGELGETHFSELRCIYDDLHARHICSPPEAIAIHSPEALPERVIEAARDTFGLPVMPSTESTGRFPGLDEYQKPASLIRYQDRQRQIQFQVLLSAFLVMLLTAGAFVAWFDLQRQKQEVASLQNRAVQLAPRAAEIRKARDRWESLAPAIRDDHFPVEIFHRIASLLPPKGIRLTEFEIREGKITIRGEASSVPMAIRFKANLEQSPDLKKFRWEVPPPQITGDTAKFVAFGSSASNSNQPAMAALR